VQTSSRSCSTSARIGGSSWSGTARGCRLLARRAPATLESCAAIAGPPAPSTNGATPPSGHANGVASLDTLSQGCGAAEWSGARVSSNGAGPPPTLAGRLGSNGAATSAAAEAGVGVEVEVGSAGDKAAALTQQVESVWISLSCQNRTGILAEAAATIAAHGYNILVRSSIAPAAFTAAQGVQCIRCCAVLLDVQFGCCQHLGRTLSRFWCRSPTLPEWCPRRHARLWQCY
jgi:hypothetical protein